MKELVLDQFLNGITDDTNEYLKINHVLQRQASYQDLQFKMQMGNLTPKSFGISTW